MVLTFYHFVNFYYLVTGDSANEEILGIAMRELHAFRENVVVFENYSKSGFEFPKMHAMMHYVGAIREAGNVANTNTEVTEARHIIDAKDPYRSSSRVNAALQMLRAVARRTSLHAKLTWMKRQKRRWSERSQQAFDVMSSLIEPDTEENTDVSEDDGADVIDDGSNKNGGRNEEKENEDEDELDGRNFEEEDRAASGLRAVSRIRLGGREKRMIEVADAAAKWNLPELPTAIGTYLWTNFILPEDKDANRVRRPHQSRLPMPEGRVLRVFTCLKASFEDIFDSTLTHCDIIRCALEWRAGGARRDCVLIRMDNNAAGHEQFAVARCLLLFEVIYKNKRLPLAYVKHYDKIPEMQRDQCPFVQVRPASGKGEVIDPASIERGAHLMPAPGHKDEHDAGGHNKYYVNAHIDKHMYHTFY